MRRRFASALRPSNPSLNTEKTRMADRSLPSTTAATGPGKREFVALVAALMASNALAIDAMLPALPAIGEALGVAEENRRQLVITSYLLGFGMAQLIYGPLADRYGRKKLLIGGLAVYGIFGLLAGLASSFALLLAARAAQGAAAAATRVLVVSIVRDRYQGSAMAQIMSTVMIVFMIVPVLAPTFGQAVLAVASWRHIFIALPLPNARSICASAASRAFCLSILSEFLSETTLSDAAMAKPLVRMPAPKVQRVIGDVSGLFRRNKRETLQLSASVGPSHPSHGEELSPVAVQRLGQCRFDRVDRVGLGEDGNAGVARRRRVDMAAGGEDEGHALVGQAVGHRPDRLAAAQVDVDDRDVEAAGLSPGDGLGHRLGGADDPVAQ